MSVPARYYLFDFRKLTVGECWRMRTNFSNFLAIYRLKAGDGDPPALTECVPEVWPAVEAGLFPAAARQALAPALTALRDVGFAVTHYGSDPLLEPDRRQVKVLLLSDDRRTGVIVNCLQQFGTAALHVGMTSRLSDGTFRVTSTSRNVFRLYPRRHWAGHPGWPAGRLYDRHLDNLDRWAREDRLDVTTYRPDEGAEVSVTLARRAAARLVERGVFRELSGEALEEYCGRVGTGS